MKKIFSLFAAVLMAGSMMADHPNLIKFTEPAAAGSLNGHTFGSEFTLTITDTGDKVSVDANNATFGVSDEGKISFNHRLKTGGKSSSANKMTLVVPEEGMLVVYARTGSNNDTTRYFVIANNSDTIVKHICKETDTVADASSKIYLPVIIENVPAGTYEVTYPVNSINFYGFDMPALEEEETHVSELLYEMTTDEKQGSNSSYAGNCDIEMGGVVWNFTGNSQMNPWRIGGKSITAATREVYTKTAYAATLDSVCLHLGNNTLTSLDGVKLVYSTNANFSEAQEVAATIPTAFPATVTFAVAGGFPAKAYYKFVFTCTVSGSSNKYIQFNGVDFWGVRPEAPAVEAPVFDVPAGSYYDEQTIHLTSATEGVAFFYTTDGTEPTSESTLYMPAYGIVLPAGTTTTIKAIAYNNDSDNPQYSEVVEKTYTIATVYNSFDSLVVKAGAPAGQKVVVNFENVVIDSLYVSSGNKTNGVYLTAAGRMVEIYCYNVPSTWAVGGTISGTVKGEWKEYLGTWEVCPSSWDGITYQAALTFEVEAGTTTFTVTPSDLEVEYYISVIPAVDEDDVPYTKEVLVTLIDGIIDDMGAGLEYFSGVQTQSYEEDWYVDEPGDYIIIVCAVNADHDARTSDVVITPFTFSPTTAIDNVEAVKATKTIENGQVVIIKNGVKYNVVGAKL